MEWRLPNGTASILRGAKVDYQTDGVIVLRDEDNPSGILFSKGTTPLMLAARNGHERIVNLLLAVKANPDLQDKGGKAALMYASQQGHGPVVQLLLDKGAQVDLKTKVNATALMFAIQQDWDKVLKILLNKGTDINASLKNGNTPLMMACEVGYTSTVQILLEHGAKNQRQRAKREYPLDFVRP